MGEIRQIVSGDLVKQTYTAEDGVGVQAQRGPSQHERRSAFEKELAQLINRHSLENGSDTPDFILAAYLVDCLDTFNRISVWRAKWYSPEGVPTLERDHGPATPRWDVKNTALATNVQPAKEDLP
jgi:hypothetical protein